MIMNKSAILRSIAESAYNIGFGGKKHFVTYDIYRIFPRAISVITMIIGVFQLLNWYKTTISSNIQDFVSAGLIAVGLIGLVLDLTGDDKENYNKVGKKLVGYFNELRRMYHQVESLDESSDFQSFIKRLEEINTHVEEIAISKQAIFTHWITHIEFFQRMQSKWVVDELGLTWKDKMPIFHWETFVFILILIIIGGFLFL